MNVMRPELRGKMAINRILHSWVLKDLTLQQQQSIATEVGAIVEGQVIAVVTEVRKGLASIRVVER
jgi:hypothetical protein